MPSFTFISKVLSVPLCLQICFLFPVLPELIIILLKISGENQITKKLCRTGGREISDLDLRIFLAAKKQAVIRKIMQLLIQAAGNQNNLCLMNPQFFYTFQHIAGDPRVRNDQRRAVAVRRAAHQTAIRQFRGQLDIHADFLQLLHQTLADQQIASAGDEKDPPGLRQRPDHRPEFLEIQHSQRIVNCLLVDVGDPGRQFFKTVARGERHAEINALILTEFPVQLLGQQLFQFIETPDIHFTAQPEQAAD